jgi:hypothetical protein
LSVNVFFDRAICFTLIGRVLLEKRKIHENGKRSQDSDKPYASPARLPPLVPEPGPDPQARFGRVVPVLPPRGSSPAARPEGVRGLLHSVTDRFEIQPKKAKARRNVPEHRTKTNGPGRRRGSGTHERPHTLINKKTVAPQKRGGHDFG